MAITDTPLSQKALAIPEAVLWKRMVLMGLDNAAAWQSAYYQAMESYNANEYQKAFQGSIIALHTLLKAKLTSNKKKKQDQSETDIFKELEEYKNSKEYRTATIMPMNYLNLCLDTLNAAIERIGITKIEIPKEDPRLLFKRG